MSKHSRPVGRISDHVFAGVYGHPDDDECTHRSDGTDATYCGEPLLAHERNNYGQIIHPEDMWLDDPGQNPDAFAR